jgi:oligopeptidase B
MKQLQLLLCSLLFVIFSYAQQPPPAKKMSTVFEEFGNKRSDDYYWMNNKADPEVLQYIQQENEYAAAILKPLESLENKLFEEMKSRQAKTFSSLPVKRNGSWYYSKTEEGKLYPIYYRRKGSMNAKEEIIQDANLLAAGNKVFYFQQPIISPNHQYAAFSINKTGDRKYTVTIKDMQTGKMLSDSVINKTFNSVVWTNDSKQFFYVVYDNTVRPFKVMLHTLGRPAGEDRAVWQENDSTFNVFIYPTTDRKYMLIQSTAATSTEVLYIPLSQPHLKPVAILPREPNLEYSIIDHYKNQFFIRTNYKAPNYRIIKTSVSNRNKDHWQDVIAARPDVYIQTYSAIVQNHIINGQRIDGAPIIKSYNLNTREEHQIDFPEQAYSVYFSVPDDSPGADSIRLIFSYYATPTIDYSYNLSNRKKTVIRQEEVNNFSPDDYTTKMLQVPARDGTPVPVSMVYRKNAYRADGTYPLLINTYSWYGLVLDPYFNSNLISLLDRGFAYVYVHARGGAEKGAEWWKAGRRLNRNNTFYDIVDAAQYLVDNKYTSPEKMVAMGVSAGGTNIGAIINLRPDLFKAVIADVPWLDVITDMKNADIPLVTAEYEEEGDPNIEEEYNYMLTWSPYDNVKKAAYPAILATAGWHDTNVPFYHAAKWAAKIREHNVSNSPVLLMTNLDAGHGWSSDRFGRMKITALKYAFLMNAVGIKE